jgi:hypothetical protein
MSNFGSLLSGQIQLPSGNNTSSSTSSSSSSSSSSSQTVSDINIFPTGNTIDPSLYVYDGQTHLLINSTVNQNNNSVQLQYFDPTTGYPNNSSGPYGYPNPMGGNNFSNWNFDLTPQNNLNGCVLSSNLLSEQTYLYDNLQPPSSSPNYLGLYSVDITNGALQTLSSGDSSSTMFFSLTSQPYLCYQGTMYSSPGVAGVPTPTNINPNYSTLGVDTFLFTSQYWVQTSNEIVVVHLVFNIANTSSTYYNENNNTINTSPAPIITVTVYNKIITREMLASVGTGNACPKPKVYSTGTISLQYLPTGETFNSGLPSQFMFNNVPIIIADRFKKTFATIGLFYIPPSNSTSSGLSNYCQFLAGNSINGTAGTLNGDGFTISNYLPTGDINNIAAYTGAAALTSPTGIAVYNGVSPLPTPTQTYYGHFVVSVAYSYNASQYYPGTTFIGEVLIKNIWRSPIAIYNAYAAFSVNDLINKQVVLLFGKTANGGTFLVTNTGTPLSQISNYGVTSLGNFMKIINAVLTFYDNNYSLSDYFTNTTLINTLNSTNGTNIQVVSLQPILEGTVSNPPTVLNCPNMWYLFLSAKNNQNLSIDPTSQQVFNYNSSMYMGLTSSTLCDTGLCKYFNNELMMLGTSKVSSGSQAFYFGNSLYIGQNTVNSQSYYMLIILPEALFNGTPLNTVNNVLSIYASVGSIFYFNYNSSSASAFVPSGNYASTTQNSSQSQNTGSTSSTYYITKITLPVSNVQLL